MEEKKVTEVTEETVEAAEETAAAAEKPKKKSTKKQPKKSAEEAVKDEAFEKLPANFKTLIEKGRSTGKLTSQEVDSLIVDMDIDVDTLENFYTVIENSKIEVVDDLLSENIDITETSGKDDGDAAAAANDNNDDPVKVTRRQSSALPRQTCALLSALPSAMWAGACSFLI